MCTLNTDILVPHEHCPGIWGLLKVSLFGGVFVNIQILKKIISHKTSASAVWTLSIHFYIQFSSVVQSCPTVRDPMNHSMPGLPVHHQIPELTQTHVHRVSDAIQPSHLLSESFPMSQLFAWGGQSTGVSALASFPPKKSQGWSPSEWTG